MASLRSYDQEIKPDLKAQRNRKTPNKCQMIDSSLLEVDQHNERRRKPRLELKDFKIHKDNDDRTIRIGANLKLFKNTIIQEVRTCL